MKLQCTMKKKNVEGKKKWTYPKQIFKGTIEIKILSLSYNKETDKNSVVKPVLNIKKKLRETYRINKTLFLILSF